METIAQEAKRLLEPIPEDQWLTAIFSSIDTKCCCAIGHYTRLKSSDPGNYASWNCSDGQSGPLRMASQKFFGDRGLSIASINNNCWHHPYTQENAKQRVMALLEDMIAAGY